MWKTIFTLVILFSAAFSLSAQTYFARTYGGQVNDQGSNVIQSSDNGFLVSAWSKTVGFGGVDVYLMKTDENGDTLWTRGFGGKQDDCCEGLLQTDDGGYVFVAYTSSKGAGSEDIWLTKLDPSGNLEWEKLYGGPGPEVCWDIVKTGDGGFLIAGASYTADYSTSQAYVLRIDSVGKLLWSKKFGTPYINFFRNVKNTHDGGFIFTGVYSTYSTENSQNLVLLKTDDSGNQEWVKTYGSSFLKDAGFAVKETSSSGFIVTGRTYAFNTGDQDVYLILTDSNGDTVWTRGFGGSKWEIGFDVVEMDDGGFAVVGITNSFGAGAKDLYLFKVDVAGNLLWERTFGGEFDDEGIALNKTKDRGLIITGNHYTNTTGTKSQIWLIKTTSEGLVTSVKNTDMALRPPTINLYPNFPNPFNPSTEIRYSIHNNDFVRLNIYNLAGQLIANLVNTTSSPGDYKIIWTPDNLAGGIYVFSLETSDTKLSKKLLYLK